MTRCWYLSICSLERWSDMLSLIYSLARANLASAHPSRKTASRRQSEAGNLLPADSKMLSDGGVVDRKIVPDARELLRGDGEHFGYLRQSRHAQVNQQSDQLASLRVL